MRLFNVFWCSRIWQVAVIKACALVFYREPQIILYNRKVNGHHFGRIQFVAMKYEEYMRKKQQETELLKTVPPTLKPYYKEKVNSYFIKLGDQ